MASLRSAFRWLWNRPGFAALAIITLALGIGANVAIFSVVNTVLLRPLPYPDPDRIVMPWEYSDDMRLRMGFDRLPSSPADVTDYARRNSTFATFASMRGDRVNLTGDGEPERVGAARVSVEFFDVLGVTAIVGRTFTADDTRSGGRTVVISESLWRRHFNADQQIPGRSVVLNGEPATIVGVLPAWFGFPSAGELPEGFGFTRDPVIWTLDVLTARQQANRGGKSFALIGRLKPGVTAAAAEADLAGIAAAIARDFPQTNAGWTVRVLSLREQLVGGIRPALLVLLTAVGFVLLIACANVANLLLVRGAARQRDLAVRFALGAARGRLVLGLIVETLLLSVAAGLVGVVVGWWLLRVLLVSMPASMSAAGAPAFDIQVVLFAVLLSMLAGTIFGVLPALHLTRGDLSEGLRDGGRGTVGSRRAGRLRNLFVVLEVSLAVVLLIGTALLVQTFMRLTDARPGFTSARVLTLDIALPPLAYPGGASAAFFDDLVARLSALPGVDAAGVTSELPLAGSETLLPVMVEGTPRPEPGQEIISDFRLVTPGYFEALSIPLVEGDGLPSGVQTTDPKVVVVNETMARVCWPSASAIGRRLKLGRFEPESPWYTVVGVVGDTKHSGLDSPPRSQVYLHLRQSPANQMTVVMRTAGDPQGLAAPARLAVRAIDPNQPVGQVRSMDDVVAASIAGRRFQMLLASVFAALALSLSLVGLYAVVSCSVAERMGELALRVALGAQPASLLRLVVSEGLILAGAGLAIGLTAALALTPFLEALLFGVQPRDPRTYALVSVSLLVAAVAGSLAPAIRAMRVDPAIALRSE